MRRIGNLIFVLLLCLVMGVTASAEGAVNLPSQLLEIKAEAFIGDTALRRVIIPDSVEIIRERAFAYSAVKEIVLPPSLTEMAANAFEGCDGIVAVVHAGSYAHFYCEENDIAYVFDPNETPYAITGLEVEGRRFLAAATTQDACVLQVEVLKEDKETVLYTVQGQVQEALDMQQVPLDIPADVVLPEFYVLRAVLLSEEGYALCNPFTTIQYTAAFDQFEKLEPDDFEESVVMSFGSGGFGVLEEGAIVIPGTSRKTDSGYIIPTSIVPEKGTVLVLTFSDGTQEPIKVKTARDNGDGTATVQHDPDTTLSELFDVFKYDNVIDVGSAAQSRSKDNEPGNDYDGSASISTAFTAGPLTISVTGKASVGFKAFYDEKLFGDKFVEMQCYLDLNATAKAEVAAAVNSEELTNAFGSHEDQPKITLYDGPIVLPDTGIVALQLEVSIPLDFELKAGGVYTMTLTSRTGLKYTPNNGIVPIKEKNTDSSFELKGGFTVKVGPKVELSVIFLHSILEASVSGHLGLQATGEAVIPVHESHTAPKEHACSLCCDMDISFFADVKAGVVAKISEKCKQTLVGAEILNLNYHISKAYFSVFNEKESIFKGDPYFNWGECPNYKYRTYIMTLNREMEEISGVPLTLLKSGALYESGESPLWIYLYDGEYKTQAAFESGVGVKEFTVLRNNQTVSIQEQAMTVSGTVTDAGTGEPAEGAQVTVMLPEGDPLIATTNTAGYYTFTFDPVESFQLSFTKDGYLTWTRNITPGAEERKITIDAQLVPGTYTVRFDANGGSGEMAEFTVNTGEGFTLPYCDFMPPEQKEFSCWMIGTDAYSPGSTYDSASGDVVVVALWANNPIPADAVYYNGHAYKFVELSVSWEAAQSYCRALGGHVVTITSEGEQEFVHAYASSLAGPWYVWIGFATPWEEWVTGEKAIYTNWGEGEPDGNGTFACMLVNDEYWGGSYHIANGQWDDWFGPTCFVCEWESACQVFLNINGGVGLSSVAGSVGDPIGALPVPTRDGYRFAGWNTAADGTGEVITPATIVTADMTIHAQWEKIEPVVPADAVVYNGHAYKLVDEYYTWTDARDACKETGGHLAAITDADEQAFLRDYVEQNGTRNNYWIGMHCETPGTWNWVTGEPFEYQNPGLFDVDYWGGAPYYGALMNVGTKGRWGDFSNQGYIPNDDSYTIRYPEQFGYLCEWDLTE